MRTETINFPDEQALAVFPEERSNLAQALAELGLVGRHPVIVLIGGGIDEQHAQITRQAIEVISSRAADVDAVVIAGGTDMGMMSEIGKTKSRNQYNFPLIGITPEALVTWPGGPRSSKFLGWGEKRWQLEPHYSHFILVPGSEFGDESAWIIDAATILSKGRPFVTILIGGGDVSRKDIELSLELGNRVIALSRTGRLADDFASQPARNELITVVPGHAVQRIGELIQAALAVTGDSQETATVPVNDPTGN